MTPPPHSNHKSIIETKAWLKRARTFMRRMFGTRWACPHRNLYHCTTQKAASQWIRRIFSEVAPASALDEHALFDLSTTMDEIAIRDPFPRWTFVTNLYVNYSTYLEMPKPGSYRTFYILRDPRDIVVSWYFSAFNSHAPLGDIPTHRAALAELSRTDGLIYSMRRLDAFGLFDAQRGWLEAANDPRVKIFRYEDLASDEARFLKALFTHCDIPFSEEQIAKIVHEHGFRAITGREHGQEAAQEHLRKGVHGDWKNYFDETCEAEFQAITGDLLGVLGYVKTASDTLDKQIGRRVHSLSFHSALSWASTASCFFA
jgi:hypothetical protein